MNEHIHYVLSRYRKGRPFTPVRNDELIPPDDVFVAMEMAIKEGHIQGAHDMATYFKDIAEVDSRFPLRAQECLHYLKMIADDGDVYAKHRLAHAHLSGRHTEKSVAKALSLLNECALKNYGPSMYSLGTLYQEGTDVDKDLKTAMDWYKKALKHGSDSAKTAINSLKKIMNSPAQQNS